MPNFEYRELKGRIVTKYGTQGEFAKAIGISSNWLSQKLTGKVGISQPEIEQWRELLDIPTSEIGKYFFA